MKWSKGALYEIISTAGHKCIFYLIEMYWILWKDLHMKIVIILWVGLQETVPLGLDSINLIIIKKFARKTWHYMFIIKGLKENAVKKYKSHRLF